MTIYPQPQLHRLHLHRPHVSLWPVAVVGLAAALIGLGTWVLVDHYAGGSSTTQDATRLVDKWAAAWSSHNAPAVASLYTKDGVLSHSTGGRTVGSQAIADLVPFETTIHLQVERIAPVTVTGDFASTFVRVSQSGLPATWLVVFQLKEGKILREWHLALGVTPPLDNITRS